MIQPCTCKHVYQDEMYGPGRRVHNETAGGYVCTVCGKEKQGKGPSVTETVMKATEGKK
jgi:hypothetical protein